MVFSVMKIFIPPERRPEATKLLSTLAGRLEIIPGFLGSWIQERNSPCSYIVYAEQWKSEEAIHEHIRSLLYRRVLEVIEFSTRAPEIVFYYVSHTEGMGLIQSLRSPSVAPGVESKVAT